MHLKEIKKKKKSNDERTFFYLRTIFIWLSSIYNDIVVQNWSNILKCVWVYYIVYNFHVEWYWHTKLLSFSFLIKDLAQKSGGYCLGDEILITLQQHISFSCFYTAMKRSKFWPSGCLKRRRMRRKKRREKGCGGEKEARHWPYGWTDGHAGWEVGHYTWALKPRQLRPV